MTKVYTLTKKLRKKLAKPFGMIFKEPEAARNVHKYLKENRTKLLISVGDVTSSELIRYGRFPHVCFIDGKAKRKKYSASWDWSGVIKTRITNPAGKLFKPVCHKIDHIIKCAITPSCYREYKMNRFIVFVKGEEDLLVIPCVKYAPIGSIIVYGQPDVGIVLIEVNEKAKAKVEEILSEMQI
jgi:uncharacterized protein (UPF0218 family)